MHPPEAVFRTKLVWLVVACGCMMLCLGIMAIAATQVIHPPRGKVQAGAYGVMALFGLGALWSAYVGFRFAGQKFAVLPDCLIIWHHFRQTTVRWDEIREVYQVVHPAWVRYRLVTRRGEFKLAGEFQRHKQLGDCISERVAAVLLPAAWDEIEAGRDVRFGPLRVSSGGVTVNGEFEPWHRIGMLTFGLNPKPVKGSLVSNMIHVRIGSVQVEMGEIPNFCVFEQLAGRLFPACLAQA